MSGLLELPSEIRFMIFAYVLPTNCLIPLDRPRKPSSLFYVSSQIRQDAIRFFFNNNLVTMAVISSAERFEYPAEYHDDNPFNQYIIHFSVDFCYCACFTKAELHNAFVDDISNESAKKRLQAQVRDFKSLRTLTIIDHLDLRRSEEFLLSNAFKAQRLLDSDPLVGKLQRCEVDMKLLWKKMAHGRSVHIVYRHRCVNLP